jgi:polysaccharide export outer membrane protein
MKTKATTIATIVSALLLFSCTPVWAQQDAVKAPAIRIASGDLIEITMYDNAELSGHFRVNENGDVLTPLLGLVHVAGETAEEAASTLEKRYVEADILKRSNSHASVFITEYATQGIVVNGDVRSPGTYPALGVRMLNDVLTAAGGVTLTAASRVIITHRGDPEHPIAVEYNPTALKPVIPQIQILPGDTVTVPNGGAVFVLGSVGRSGAIPMDARNPVTVLRAIATANPDRHGATLSNVQLVRTGEDGRKVAITINVSKIEKGRAADIALRDGDVLFVPNSLIKEAGPQAIGAAIGLATAATLYSAFYH